MSFGLKKKNIWLPLLNLTGFASMEFTAVGNTFAWGEKCLLQVRTSEREKTHLEPSGKGGFQNASHIAIFKSRVVIIQRETCVGSFI